MTLDVAVADGTPTIDVAEIDAKDRFVNHTMVWPSAAGGKRRVFGEALERRARLGQQIGCRA